jgi:hypothetical protein
MDRTSQIASALAAGLKLLGTVDAISGVERKALRDEGAIDEATYLKLAGRTDASDFTSLVSFVRERLPDATPTRKLWRFSSTWRLWKHKATIHRRHPQAANVTLQKSRGATPPRCGPQILWTCARAGRLGAPDSTKLQPTAASNLRDRICERRALPQGTSMPMRLTSRIPPISASLLAATIAIGTGSAARAARDCIEQPTGEVSHGAHWYYHVDRTNKRKCWYLGVPAAMPPQAASPALAPTELNLQSPISSLLAFLSGGLLSGSPQDIATSDPRTKQVPATKPLKIEDIVPTELTRNARHYDSNGILASDWRSSEGRQNAPPQRRSDQYGAPPINQAERDALFREYLRWQELQKFPSE